MRIFDATTGAKLHEIDHGKVRVYAVAFGGGQSSTQSEMVVTGDGNGRIKVVDADTGEELVQQIITSNADDIYAVAFDCMGKTLALGCEDAKLRILSFDRCTRSCHVVRTVMHGDGVCSVDFDDNGEVPRALPYPCNTVPLIAARANFCIWAAHCDGLL